MEPGVAVFGVFVLLFGVTLIRSGVRSLRNLRAEFDAEQNRLEGQHDAEVFRLEREGVPVTAGRFYREPWDENRRSAAESAARSSLFYGILLTAFGAVAIAASALLAESAPRLKTEPDYVPVDRSR